MKSTNRVRPNNNTSQSQRQAQPVGRIDPVPAYLEEGGYSLQLFSQALDGYVAAVQINPIEFNAIHKKAQLQGISLNEFIKSAVHDATSERFAEIGTAMQELEWAKWQSEALFQLIADSMEVHAQNGPWNDKIAERMSAGIQQLVESTNSRCNSAFNALRSVLYPKRQEVAS